MPCSVTLLIQDVYSSLYFVPNNADLDSKEMSFHTLKSTLLKYIWARSPVCLRYEILVGWKSVSRVGVPHLKGHKVTLLTYTLDCNSVCFYADVRNQKPTPFCWSLSNGYNFLFVSVSLHCLLESSSAKSQTLFWNTNRYLHMSDLLSPL